VFGIGGIAVLMFFFSFSGRN